MNFFSLFSNYKKGLKVVNKNSKTKCARIQKIVSSVSCVFLVLCVISIYFKWDVFITVFSGICAVPSILIGIYYLYDICVGGKKSENIIDEDYSFRQKTSAYYLSRINMMKRLLRIYGISVKDVEKIKLLISEAKDAKNKYCHLFYVGDSPFNHIIVLVTSVLTVVLGKIVEGVSSEYAIILSLKIALCILFIMMVYSVFMPILRTVFYPDYSKYDDFIYDLEQILIFYS